MPHRAQRSRELLDLCNVGTIEMAPFRDGRLRNRAPRRAAFLPQFVAPAEPGALLQMLGLSAVFMVVTFVVFAGYGTFAAAVREHVISRPRAMKWMRRVFAGTFVALGARLVARCVQT